jgi:hypothetical protein
MSTYSIDRHVRAGPERIFKSSIDSIAARIEAASTFQGN